MSSNTALRSLPAFLRRGLLWKIPVALAVIVAVAWLLGGDEESLSQGTTFAARRGPLKITVLEGGSVSAIESQEIKSEIKGQTKILSIVDEGYQVTEQDVEDGKILVTLDNSEILEKLTQQEIEYQSALATYTDTREQYGIQIKQNESDIKTAELDAKFAQMDFRKYLGAELADEILDELGLTLPPPEDYAEALAALEETLLDFEEGLPPTQSGNHGGADTDAEAQGAVSVDVAPPPANQEPNPQEAGQDTDTDTADESEDEGNEALRNTIDFSKYADSALLGDGEAQQKLRKLENERLLAEEEKRLAIDEYEGTKRLAAKQYVTESELDRDEIAVKRNEVTTESALTEEELFRKYEFPKEAEKLLSDFEEALRKLERVKKEAVSKLAQAKAKFKSSEARFNLQRQRRDELRDQLEKCTIRAERPGLVVYAGSNEPWRRQERIEEGATVYERQEIITIPDMTQMGVEVKVHESAIKKVKKGQKVSVRIDAFLDQQFEGVVEKVSVLPDAGHRWMNPDLKLYPTNIRIEGTHEGLKPGLSAEAEILVNELTDVVHVPIQAVSDSNGERVCYVLGRGVSSERRPIETGQFNDEFIEIRNGLEEGERVLLRAPSTAETEQQPEPDKPREPQDSKPKDAPPAGGGRSQRDP